mmetsp:Transcript_19998/g.59413  ORF Transcript_19998/g.59413 Transcript_19998/m.59413 type:complete len:224 (+) Transcript_19998:234-905(+)
MAAPRRTWRCGCRRASTSSLRRGVCEVALQVSGAGAHVSVDVTTLVSKRAILLADVAASVRLVDVAALIPAAVLHVAAPHAAGICTHEAVLLAEGHAKFIVWVHGKELIKDLRRRVVAVDLFPGWFHQTQLAGLVALTQAALVCLNLGLSVAASTQLIQQLGVHDRLHKAAHGDILGFFLAQVDLDHVRVLAPHENLAAVADSRHLPGAQAREGARAGERPRL